MSASDPVTFRDLKAVRKLFESELKWHRRLSKQHDKLLNVALDKAEAILKTDAFPRKEELASAIQAVRQELGQNSEKVDTLEKWAANLMGRIWAIGAGVVLLTLAITFAGVFLRH